MSNHNDGVIEEFRRNQGRVGGPFEGAPLLLLHTVGRRTGKTRINPLMYLPGDERFTVFASKGGSPHHPHWLLNLEAEPHVQIEVGVRRLSATATILWEGAERDVLYAEQVRRYPMFGEYQRKTTRTIPVIVLDPAEPSGSSPVAETTGFEPVRDG